MVRGFLLFIPVVVLCTACPEVWGREGMIEKAMEKDVRDGLTKNHRPPDCQLTEEEWAKVCDGISDRELTKKCPRECRRDK